VQKYKPDKCGFWKIDELRWEIDEMGLQLYIHLQDSGKKRGMNDCDATGCIGTL
jgi:hypothetical protein